MEFFGYGRKTTPQKSAGPAAALQEIMQQEFEIDAVGSEFMPSLPQYDLDLEPDEAPRATRDFTPLEVPVGRRGGPKKRSSSLPPSMVRKQAAQRIDDWAAYNDRDETPQMASLTVVTTPPPAPKRRSLLQKARDVGRAHMLPRLIKGESYEVANGTSTARTSSCDVGQALRDRGRFGSMSTCVVEVAFLDGSSIKVTARNDDTCRSIQSAAALAIGVGAEYVSALGLYAYDGDGRCAARHEPDATARSLRNQSVVLAVRLITTAQLAAAARGFRTSTASALELHAQACCRVREPHRRGSGASRRGMAPRRNANLAIIASTPSRPLTPKRNAGRRLRPRRALRRAVPRRCIRRPRGPAPLGARARPGDEARPGRRRRRCGKAAGPHAAGDARRPGVRERRRGPRRAALDGHLAQKAAKRDKARAVAQAPKKAAKIELEIVEPVADGERVVSDDGDAPEAAFLATVASKSRFGAQLFPCAVRRRAPGETMRDQACPPRVLAVSRDGAAILSNDLTSELQSVPFAKLRRWTRDKSIIRFEAEQPFDCWGPAFMRRRSTSHDDARRKRLRRLAALSKGRATQPKVAASWWFSPAPKQLPEAPASLSEDESSVTTTSTRRRGACASRLICGMTSARRGRFCGCWMTIPCTTYSRSDRGASIIPYLGRACPRPARQGWPRPP